MVMVVVMVVLLAIGFWRRNCINGQERDGGRREREGGGGANRDRRTEGEKRRKRETTFIHLCHRHHTFIIINTIATNRKPFHPDY
jgi:hypothetical protein